MKSIEHVLFRSVRLFFHLIVAREHSNKQKKYLYYEIYWSSCRIYIFKNRDITGFFINKPRHQGGQKNPDLGGKT